jgi:plastocyanin
MKKLLFTLLTIHYSFIGFTKTHYVEISNNKFSPADLEISVGDEVVWKNTADMQHSSTSGTDCKPNGTWNSNLINPGKTFSYKFTNEGDFNYFCIPHCSIGMKGIIHVKKGINKGSIIKSKHKSESRLKNKFNDQPSASNHSNTFIAMNDQNEPLGPGFRSAMTHTVKMVNYKFEPSSLTINPGDTVVWMNTTEMIHTSTSGTNCANDGNWNSGNVEPGKEFKHVFTNPGSYSYFCMPHCLSGMTGTIQVGQSIDHGTHVMEEPNKTNTNGYFKSTDIINNQSVATLKKGYLEFKIYHRFDDLAGKVGNSHNFYGLDNIREYRLGFAYGITDRLMVGVGRNKGDQFQSPYQQIAELYDGFLKYRVLVQDNEPNGKSPISLSLFANTVVSGMKSQSNNVFSEAYFPHFSDRFSYAFQALIAYNLLNRVSLQLIPTWVKRNWVNPWVADKDEINLLSLGGAARWNLTKHFSLLGEYFYTFSHFRERHDDVYHNPLAVGLEISTGKHIFHLNLSNSTGVIPNTFIPYTTSSWWKGQFRFGFSITRLFLVNKPKTK